MNVKHESEWNEDPRLTAYALGELEGEERAAFEARIEGNPQALALIAELRALGGELETEFAAEAVTLLSTPQRAAIERAMESGSASGPRGFRLAPRLVWIGLAAAGALTAAVLFQRETTPSVDQASFTYDISGEGGALGRGVVGRSKRPDPGRSEESNYLGYTGSLEDLGYADSVDLLEEEVFGEEVEEPFFLDHGMRGPVSQGDMAQGEEYDRIEENEFRRTSEAPLSTFSIDVDTASYANVRRMLRGGGLPPPDAVRIEEFINYFPYDYGAPTGDHPFHVDVDVGGSPWSSGHRIVRIGIEGRRTLAAERKASNLVFLMDVSGSMDSPDKLPLLKKALHLLVQELDGGDRVAIVVYAGASGLVLPSTPCDQGLQVHMALEALDAGGSTHGSAGIELAYQVAAQNFIRGGINRVILATDGDFNVGVQSDGSLTRLIEEKARSGVFLSVLGFGTGNLKDSRMEQLADRGNGHYAYIDSVLEARKVLVEELGSTLETIAKDVKVQVEFNPGRVQAWRLIGYENRLMAARDFNDDSKDAGEIGAGQRVTALFEVVPVGVPFDGPEADPLRYQTPGAETGEAFGGELGWLELRYKQPDGEQSRLVSAPIPDSRADFQELSGDTRWAAAVAAFGMLLRHSEHSGTATLEDVSRWALESAGPDPGGYRAQFIGLVSRARELMGE